MATDQFVTDLTTAVNDYVIAVGQYQTNVQTEVGALNQQIAALQTQLTNAPDDQAAVQSLIANLKTQTTSVTTAANAILPSPVVPPSTQTTQADSTQTATEASNSAAS